MLVTGVDVPVLDGPQPLQHVRVVRLHVRQDRVEHPGVGSAQLLQMVVLKILFFG